MDNWYKIKDKLPEPMVEVLVYNKDCAQDEEFNPDGVHIGFMLDEKTFIVLSYDEEYESGEANYVESHEKYYPTHWQPKPSAPKD
jgi:hypothetical protein